MSRDAALKIVVAVIQNPAGDYLLGLRPVGKPLSGFWEFPGGKVEEGETAYEALCRELEEELGIQVKQAEHFFEYAYNDLDFSVWRVVNYEGELQPLVAEKLKWSSKAHLRQHVFPPANRAILNKLEAPWCGKLCS